MADRTERSQRQERFYQQLIQAVQTSPGTTISVLRRAVTTYTQNVSLSGFPVVVPENTLPSDLQSYLTKLCRNAYKVTDNDIGQLRRAGYSEEAIFEITVSAALGAGTRCLESGLAALEEASDAITDH